MFIGLNPSTATAEKDDPTIRRCVAFARAWGHEALCMTNLFAYRATDPSIMKEAPDPVGPGNDATLLRLAHGAGIVIAAWGVHGTYQGRDQAVRRLIPAMHYLSLTKAGSPGHPLYLPGNLRPTAWTE